MVTFTLRLTPLVAGMLIAFLTAWVMKVRPKATEGGRGASAGSYPTAAQQYADAVEALVSEGGGGVGTEVVLHVRGDGCTMDDGTPIPETVVARLAPQSLIRALVHDADGRPINASGVQRHPTARQKRVVKERDRECVDCGRAELLEYDHVPAYEETGRTVGRAPTPLCTVSPGQARCGMIPCPGLHIDNRSCQKHTGIVLELHVIDEPDVAAAVMEPLRARVLAALCEPGSSTTVAEALGEPRQKVNYHLRALEEKGLVQLVEERPRRGLTERVMVATARSYVVSPAVLGQSAPEPERTDRLSARYLIALAARMVTEVGGLLRKSEAADKSLATLALDTEIRFATASERAAFTHELSEAITELCGKYHDESAPRGRWHRLVVAAHPRPAPSRPPTTTATTTTREAEQ